MGHDNLLVPIAKSTRVLNLRRKSLLLELSHRIHLDETMPISRHVRDYSVAEQISHFLKRQPLSLGHVFREEDNGYDVASNEDEVVPLFDVCECFGSWCGVDDCAYEIGA